MKIIFSLIKFLWSIVTDPGLWKFGMYFIFFGSIWTISAYSDGDMLIPGGIVAFGVTATTYNINLLCSQSLIRLHTVEQLLRNSRTAYRYGRQDDSDVA